MNRGRRAGVLLGFTLAVAIGPWVGGRPTSAHASTPSEPRRALLLVTEPATFREFMSEPAFRQLARAGGAGLLVTNQTYRSDATAAFKALVTGAGPIAGTSRVPTLITSLRPNPVLVCAEGEFCPPQPNGLQVSTTRTLSSAAEIARRFAAAVPGANTLIIVLSLQPTAGMNRVGDEASPIVMAEGVPSRLFPTNGPMHALTSETTRFTGVVANVDVAPTILAFFDVPVPSSMSGSPIRVTGAGAPFTLDRRQIEYRSIRAPLQIAEGIFVSGAGLAVIIGLLALDRRGRISPRAALAWRVLMLVVVALPIPLALGGLLPRFTYATVGVWIVVWTGLITVLALTVRRSDPMFALTFLGIAGLVVLFADLLFGAHGLRVPLLGGTMFEGVRMYGLPNAFISTLLASGLFCAARLDVQRGAILLAACGLVAGLPQLGADVGASITLFAAAGLWWQLRSRGRLGIRELVVAFLVTVAGLAVVLLVSRFGTSAPTHATRFVEQTGTSPSSAVAEVRHRLWVGIHQVASYPVSAIPLIGLPIVLWAAVRAPGVIGRGFARAPRWRDVTIVTALAAAVAYIANDTGMAAAAPSLLYCVAAIAYPAFVYSTGPPPARAVEREREASAA